jgi:hypothetical protein
MPWRPGLCGILCPIVRRRLVAVISYAISNSVGFALLSGSAIRYRLYAQWGLTPGQIGKSLPSATSAFGLACLRWGCCIYPGTAIGSGNPAFALRYGASPGIGVFGDDCRLSFPQRCQSAIAQNQRLGAASPAAERSRWPRLPSPPAIGPWRQRCSMCCCPLTLT